MGVSGPLVRKPTKEVFGWLRFGRMPYTEHFCIIRACLNEIARAKSNSNRNSYNYKFEHFLVWQVTKLRQKKSCNSVLKCVIAADQLPLVALVTENGVTVRM